jgi:hypothetical protein
MIIREKVQVRLKQLLAALHLAGSWKLSLYRAGRSALIAQQSARKQCSRSSGKGREISR